MERIKIADLKLGEPFNLPLVVSSATARKTKTQKDYLSLEFFDGFEKINGNYWDWTSGKIPEINSIVDVRGQVAEWQGNLQLNVHRILATNEYDIADFMPSSGLNPQDVFKACEDIIDSMEDEDLKTLTLAIFAGLQDAWMTIPGAVRVHHAYVAGTMIHSLETARVARNIAEVLDANIDLCIAGGLLHDLGKLFTYKLNGVIIEYTSEGVLMDHTFMGANFISNYADKCLNTDNPYVSAKVKMLVHIVLSHHEKLEYGAAVPPSSIEAHIVAAADGLSAVVDQVRFANTNGAMLTEKLWALNNRPHIQEDYTQKIFAYEADN